MKKWLDEEFTSSGWREVTNYNDNLKSNEWLVCMRVGVNKDIITDEKGNKGLCDYHFWYRQVMESGIINMDGLMNQNVLKMF